MANKYRMTREPRGEVHDAGRVCLPGFSCWIGATVLDGDRFRPDTSGDVTVEGSSKEETEALLRAELTKRGFSGAEIWDVTRKPYK
jgi:hypothetical protein